MLEFLPMRILRDIGEYVAKVSPAIIGGSFFASACYDYGFLYKLNLNFLSVPSTFNDNIRSSLNWLPLLLLTIIFPFLFGMLVKHVSNASPTGVRVLEVVTPSMPNFLASFFIAGSTIASVTYIFKPEPLLLISSFSSLACGLIFHYIHAFQISHVLILYFVITSSTLLFKNGYSDAAKLLSEPTQDEVYFVDAERQRGTVLKYYENYLMLYTQSPNRIVLIERGKVKKVIRQLNM